MANSSASYVGWVVDEEHQEEKKQLHPAQALTAGITAMCSQWWLLYCWEAITFVVSSHVKPFPVKATVFFLIFRVKPPDLGFKVTTRPESLSRSGAAALCMARKCNCRGSCKASLLQLSLLLGNYHLLLDLSRFPASATHVSHGQPDFSASAVRCSHLTCCQMTAPGVKMAQNLCSGLNDC